jgi:hypothetical protein
MFPCTVSVFNADRFAYDVQGRPNHPGLCDLQTLTQYLTVKLHASAACVPSQTLCRSQNAIRCQRHVQYPRPVVPAYSPSQTGLFTRQVEQRKREQITQQAERRLLLRRSPAHFSTRHVALQTWDAATPLPRLTSPSKVHNVNRASMLLPVGRWPCSEPAHFVLFGRTTFKCRLCAAFHWLSSRQSRI